MALILPSTPLELEAQRLVAQGYYQTSRRYCSVARLPEGVTGRDALARAATRDMGAQAWAWTTRMSESDATDQYLRVYAPEAQCLRLSPELFAAFRRMGGTTAR